MSRSSLLLVAAALTAFGAAVLSGHPPWGAVAAISILLTAAAMAAGALANSRQTQSSQERAGGQRISASLVTLSATAVLAVYAAGYQRTRDAADHFEAQSARHQAATAPSAGAELPKPVEQARTPAISPPIASRPAAVPSPAAAPAPSAESANASHSSDVPAASLVLPPAPPPVPEPAAAIAVKSQSSYKDGTFSGWGRCRHGNIEATVTIASGQITGTAITQCLTRYSCSWIENLPGQVVTRQSADVDYVSGATESTDAFYDAVASALASARE